MESLAPWAGRNRKTDMDIVSVVNTAQMLLLEQRRGGEGVDSYHRHQSTTVI